MEKYIPDIYKKSIYTIDYNKLYNRGIRCLLFDLDNTLVPLKSKSPSKKLKEFIDGLKEQGFKIIIVTNCKKKRLKPFIDSLEIEGYSMSCKPLSKTFEKILNSYKYKQSEIAIIGDQMITDIAGGNKIGITTILINPISKKDLLFTKLLRLKEKRIMKKLRKNNLFVKGRYYD